jgi:hypothetical protein
VQKDVPTFPRQRVELRDLSAFWRVNSSSPDIGKPSEVLLVHCVLRDAGFLLHRLGNSQALCAIGRDLGADLVAFAGSAPCRGRKNFGTDYHAETSANSGQNSAQDAIGRYSKRQVVDVI